MEFLLFHRVNLVVIGKRTTGLSSIGLLLVLVIEELMCILVICTYIRLVDNWLGRYKFWIRSLYCPIQESLNATCLILEIIWRAGSSLS